MSIEAMKQALEALEKWAGGADEPAITSLRQAIAEAEKQEPVAWVDVHDYTNLYYRKPAQVDVVPLYYGYTHPPKREWQNLTDDEIKDIIGPWGDTPIKGYTRQLFDKIEAKLKEKNHDQR